MVGGGQAGLTAGYHLKRAGVPFVILDAAARGGQSWRERWDSLELFTPAGYSALPELPFPGDQERYPGKDEVADYLETYADELELPVRRGARVTALERSNGEYRVTTESDTLHAGQVIVAVGAYQRPHIPPIADGLSDVVIQLHSAAYRNPEQVPARRALVVGAANSGAQIAEDLAPSHQVFLSRGSWLPHLPRRILGRSLHWWGDHLGLIAAPLHSWRGRTQRGELLVGESLRRRARRAGIELLGRAVEAERRTAGFDDGRTIEFDAVIWATGYRSDYSWIHIPVFDEGGAPRHRRGVTDAPGLYFLGMHGQYSRGSSLLYWVREDAAYLVEKARELHDA